MDSKQNVSIAILMGSQSDWPVVRHASLTLNDFNIAHESLIISAHRKPERLRDYVQQEAPAKGVKIFIAAAGGAAHLPGVIASLTRLPVFGIPMESQSFSGMDSLLSIVQMPKGIPVGTLAVGKAGAVNAALLAVRIMAAFGQDDLAAKLKAWQEKQAAALKETPIDS